MALLIKDIGSVINKTIRKENINSLMEELTKEDLLMVYSKDMERCGSETAKNTKDNFMLTFLMVQENSPMKMKAIMKDSFKMAL